MDFNLKQWRFHHQQKQDESDLEQHQHHHQQQQQTPSGPNSALPLFVSEITNNNTNNDNKSMPLSPPPPPSSSSSKMGSTSSCYFSLMQWQELELQALIYKHMLAGAAIPPQLLHLLNKTLLLSSPPPPPYALHPHHPHHPFYQYSHYQSPLLQSGVGYWGRPGGSIDLEPGRCRRTDGKKWRCSRDVVAAHKYCDRHMHRGRNRSRKPVESSSTIASAKSLIHSGTTSHPNHRRTLDVGTENKGMFGMQNEVAMPREMKPGGERVLRHFFDDWPRPLHEAENAEVHNTATANLSISTNVSDFSLKLATGHEEENNNNAERDLNQLNWASGWRGAGPMGGPLAEALRSSLGATTTDSSPTSVLHHLARNPKPDDTSYVSNP